VRVRVRVRVRVTRPLQAAILEPLKTVTVLRTWRRQVAWG
jgi:hypothetical protein